MGVKSTTNKGDGLVSAVRLSDMRDAGVSTGRFSSLLLSGRSWLLNTSWWRVGAVLVSVATLVAVLAFAAGYPAWWGGAAAAGVAAVVLFAAVSAQALKASIVWFLFFPFAPVVGYYYVGFTSGLAQPRVSDAGVGALGLLLALFFVTVGTLKWGRGKAWVTVGLAAFSFIVPGLAVLAAFPQLGFLAAWGSAAFVALLRWGAWTWLVSLVLLALRGKDDPLPCELPVHSALVSFALNRIPDGYAVFSHDGVAGVVVVDSRGSVEETRKDGVTISGVNVGEVAVRALRAAKRTARLAGLPRGQVPAIVLVRGSKSRSVYKTVGVYVQDGDEASAAVQIVGEASLLDTIGADTLPKKVRRLCLVSYHRDRRSLVRG